MSHLLCLLALTATSLALTAYSAYVAIVPSPAVDAWWLVGLFPIAIFTRALSRELLYQLALRKARKASSFNEV